MPCPFCGRPISPTIAICPRCGRSVVGSASSEFVGPSALSPPPAPTPPARAIFGSVFASLAVAALLIELSFWVGSRVKPIGEFLVSSDFIVVPMAMGFVAAWFWRKLKLTTGQYFFYSSLSGILALVVSAFFMHEGVICLVIVSPLLFLMVFVGSLLGRWAFSRGNNRLQLSVLPLLTTILICDSLAPHHYQNSVSDTIVIHAPPAIVWRQLARVPPIDEKPTFWLSKIGLPYPIEARAKNAKIGTARQCIFSGNLIFEEKITESEPGKKLTFDIVKQPDDPEIWGHAAVKRGQFILKDNGDGTTTLTGKSDYELYVFPANYYDIWAKSIARQVHLRVMDAIKKRAEADKKKAEADA